MIILRITDLALFAATACFLYAWNSPSNSNQSPAVRPPEAIHTSWNEPIKALPTKRSEESPITDWF